MTIEGVGFDHQEQTVVVLKDWEGHKLLPIWIGQSEARSIALELEGAQSPRPLSHDLVLSCIKLVNGRVTRVVINDLQNSTFYATIDIDTPNGLRHIDSRPSDAIAIAVRAKCPVFVDGGALNALIEVSEATAANEATEETDEMLAALASEIAPAPAAPEPPEDDEITRFKRLLGDLEV